MKHYLQSLWVASIWVIIPLASYTFLAPSPLVNADSQGLGQVSPFQDISGSYAQEQIIDLYNRNIVTGMGNQLFEPTRPVTRAECITMLDRMLHIQPVHTDLATFFDVPSYTWEYPFVQAGVSLQLVNGTGAHTYEPDRPVSREEAASMFAHVLQELPNHLTNGSEKQTFSDISSVSPWAIPYVQQMQALGIMTGDDQGNFRPQDPLTREEIAVVFENLLKDLPQAQTTATVATLSTVSPSTGPNGIVQGKPLIQLGWQYGQTTQQFEAGVQASNTVNTVSPSWFYLGKDGQLQKSTAMDPTLVTWANQNRKQVWPLVGNHFDPAATHLVLTDPTLRTNFENQLASYATQYKVDGYNIDFEGMDSNDKDNFSKFIQELSTVLHRNQVNNHPVILSVDIPPDIGTDWSAPFDYQVLGQGADYLILMEYDEHWEADNTPGSVSSLPWLEAGVQQLLQHVSAEKVILGLPFYTRDWYIENGKQSDDEIPLPEEIARTEENGVNFDWDNSLGQYTATYITNGVQHTIWIEDSRSLSLKTEFAMQKGVAGFAYWYIGGETSDIWLSLSNIFNFYSTFATHS